MVIVFSKLIEITKHRSLKKRDTYTVVVVMLQCCYEQVSAADDLIIAPSMFHSTSSAVYTISLQQQDHVISDSSPKLDTVHFISLLTGQSSELSVLCTSHTSSCVSQSDHSVDDSILPSATPSSTLHKIPLLQQVSAVLGEELIVVMVTGIAVLIGFVAVCCSLWRHGNRGSANQSGFSFYMPSPANSTSQPLPPILMSPASSTPPGSSPRQSPHSRVSAFTPTNNSPHYTLYKQ